MSDTQPRTIRAVCQHCKRPITYSAVRMEWWHNFTEAAYVASGEAPCTHAQPPNRAGAVTRDGGE